jgi:cytochrome c
MALHGSSRSIPRGVALMILAAGFVGAPFVSVAEETSYGLGRPVSPETIARIDIDVMPDGRGLPAGGATAAEGRAVYEASCEQCHGAEAHGGPNGSLAGEPVHSPEDIAADRTLKRTVGNYWPYATTLFDYVRRAMPYDRPGSLSDQEVYAVTAYVLFANGLVDENTQINAETLPGIRMPLQSLFTPATAWEDKP